MFFKGKREGFFRDSRRVSKKGSKIGKIARGVSKKEFKSQKIAKGVLQKYSPHGLDSRQRGGVMASRKIPMPCPFHWSKFPELHHTRNNRTFLKSGDKTQGKETQGREEVLYLVSHLVFVTR